ncbi:subtilisin-like protease SBT1.8 [Punica granatum]|uniref:Subtilisin-like protease SBT1.8 n=1 Tax=Punica granatum TaxID=22663 RepID=A0A6P8CB48_PUNGR|nr:subtilisin-like protease SBT1.8 [Punica granatum]
MDWYMSSLSSATSGPTDNLLYMYENAYQGFAASLEPEQAEALRKQSYVLGMYEDVPLKLHTTHTPSFLKSQKASTTLGFQRSQHDGSANVRWDLISIPSAVIKSSSEHNSSRRGILMLSCNRFTRYYYVHVEGNTTGVLSPRDHQGHGTHTASTAAGSPVPGAAFLGKVMGTARSMAPHARVAIYKVCWDSNCWNSDILAGMDQAIKDGVDIMSLSLGGSDMFYFDNSVTVGAFTAMEKGIFVSALAGNEGPESGTVKNGAPWIMTVSASSIDRDLPANIFPWQWTTITGLSKYAQAGLDKPVGLVYNKGIHGSNMCLNGTLDPAAVKGKVVLCDRGGNERVEKGLVVRNAGGIGMILANTQTSDRDLASDPHFLRAVMVGVTTGNTMRQYVMSDPNPIVRVTFTPYRLNVRPAPVVAKFSSRGPYNPSVQILKLDVIAPGVDIVSAWTNDAPPTKSPFDKRRVQFNIESGTSMSCPHVSGLAALLRAAHPEWSTSAIKRPITDGKDSSVADPWTLGSGHVDPQEALSPGLVYNLTRDDYMAFICGLNYTIEQVQLVVRDPSVNCSRKFSNLGELNYPSFSVIMNENRTVIDYAREVTNVGAPGSTYQVAIATPRSVAVNVQPMTLAFGPVGDKKRYTVTFAANSTNGTDIDKTYGFITWYNREHRVRTPMVFTYMLS